MEKHSHNPNQIKCCDEDVEKEASSLRVLKEKWVTYKPLIIILIFCSVMSLSYNAFVSHPFEAFMSSFMGFFFVFLSLFKFFDLKSFVDGFATYDLITKRFRAYGYAYPFIEFFLGLMYLIQFDPFLTNGITVVVMTVNGIGVLKSISSGKSIKCACLGTVLDVPLSTVSVLENFGMGTMAAYKLAF